MEALFVLILFRTLFVETLFWNTEEGGARVGGVGVALGLFRGTVPVLANFLFLVLVSTIT